MNVPLNVAESFVKAHECWNAQQRIESGSERADSAHFTIALSRETGTYGAAIAREVGNRLGWPVYDSELLQRIADDMGVHRNLLENVDERQQNWLSECLAALSAQPGINQSAYFRRLVETLLSLASHGHCVIVGRGATKVLPQATTLRVRIVAPREQRILAVQREHKITLKEATARVENTDRERNRFVMSHFQIDPTDPANYDLVLNAGRLSCADCAEIVIAALDRLRNLAPVCNAQARSAS